MNNFSNFQRNFLVIGNSSVNAGSVTPTLLSVPNTTVCTLTSNAEAKNMDQLSIRLPSGSMSTYKVYGTAYSDEMQTIEDRNAFMEMQKSRSLIINRDHDYLGELTKDTNVILTCSRDHTKEYTEAITKIPFVQACIPVVVLDNNYNIYMEMKSSLERQYPNRFCVVKGVVHCVVPPTKYEGRNNHIRVAEPYTQRPYIVIPPLADGVLQLSPEIIISTQPRLILAKSSQEMEYHVKKKAGVNILHQLWSANAQLKMASGKEDVEAVREKPFSEYLESVGKSFVVDFTCNYAEGFFSEFLEEYSDEYSSREGFIDQCLDFVLYDLWKDKIGRALRDVSKFEVYKDYYSRMQGKSKELIEEYARCFS